MREDLLKEIEMEYEQVRIQNERTEVSRKERIRQEQPEIFALIRQREELIFGTLRDILAQKAEASGLSERMEQLSAAIREKLTENGYPEDYLFPIYRCPVCRDRGYTGEPIREPCACLKKAYQEKLRQSIGLSSVKKESFETFDLSVFSTEKLPGRTFSQREYMGKIRKDCEEWADTYPDSFCRDLVLSGKAGLGKTFLLRAMAERLIERDINVVIVSAYRLIDMVRKDYFSGENQAKDLAEADVLMIDDLGSEPLMQNVTVEQLFNLLNERQNRGLSTVISTNLDISEFRSRYTERIASRIRDREHCKILNLEGKDIRAGGFSRE